MSKIKIDVQEAEVDCILVIYFFLFKYKHLYFIRVFLLGKIYFNIIVCRGVKSTWKRYLSKSKDTLQ